MLRSHFLLATAVLFAAKGAFAHARITSPPPRDNAADHKAAPCGAGIAKAAAKKVYPAGTTQIPLEWEETIQHGGWFAIDLSLGNDQNFQLIDMVKDPGDGALVSTKGAPHMVNLPANTTCANCTLRLRQVMCTSSGIDPNDAKCVATIGSNISTYYSCADIQIGDATAAVDAGTPPADAGSTVTDSGTSTPADDGGAVAEAGAPNGNGGGNGNNKNDDFEDDGEFNQQSSCSTTGTSGSSLAMGAMVAVAIAVARRRRK